MEEIVQSIGVPAVVALLLLQQVQRMLEGRSPAPTDELHKALVRKVDDLWQWHSLEDEDGVKRWYSPAHLGERLSVLERKVDRLLEEK